MVLDIVDIVVLCCVLMLRADKAELHIAGRGRHIPQGMYGHSVILNILGLCVALYPRALIGALGADNAE